MASTRRGFDLLSPGVRRRYESAARRQGISDVRAYYESGQSLAALRGHAATPERPERLDTKPQYARYRRQRDPKEIRVVTTDGVKEVSGMSKIERHIVSRHSNAIHAYMSGRLDSLDEFRGETVVGFLRDDTQPRTFTLATDPDMILAEYYEGNLNYPSIYTQAAA